jgi:hypothetical protein
VGGRTDNSRYGKYNLGLIEASEERQLGGKLVSAFILLFTVLAVLTLGIATAYGTIFTILSALAPRPSQPTPIRPVLAASQSMVSGD